MWFANIFSQSIGCLFILLIFFSLQKLFSLMWFHLFIFAFVACALGVMSIKVTAKTSVKELFPYVFF